MQKRSSEKRAGAVARQWAVMLGMVVAAVLPTHLGAQISTTTVQGTIYRADGTAASGTLLVSWSAFTTAQNQAVAAGNLSAAIGADGFVSVNLTPNAGAQPSGSYYTAVYQLSDGTVSREYWVVPASGTATVAAVRAQLEPSTVAVQTVSQSYLNSALASLSSSWLPLTGGTLTGPLTLSADPTSANQAATRHYADQIASASFPLSGGTLSGPVNAPSYNNRIMADQQSGTDFCAKVNAALGLATAGQVVDATGLIGAQTCNSGSININTSGTTLLLPATTISGSAAPLINAGCGVSNTTIQGQMGTTLQPTGANGAIHVGCSSTSGATYTQAGLISNVQINDPSGSTSAYGIWLQNVIHTELTGIIVNCGGHGQYGFILEGYEQSHFHANTAQNCTATNLDARVFTYGGTNREASLNGVMMDGNLFQQSQAGATGMTLELNCCDDFGIIRNEFDDAGTALANIEILGQLSGAGGLIEGNHVECMATSNLTSAWNIILNGAQDVVVRDNPIIDACYNSPYTNVWVTNGANGTIIDGNNGGGLMQIDAGTTQGTVADNKQSSGSGWNIVNNAADTEVYGNSNASLPDVHNASSGNLSPDIMEFRPKFATASPYAPAGTNWGVTIEGQPSGNAGKETYLRWMGTDGSAPMSISCKSGTSGYCFAHGSPGDGANYWNWTSSLFSLNEAAQVNGSLAVTGMLHAEGGVAAASMNGEIAVDGVTYPSLNAAWNAAVSQATASGQNQTIRLGPGTYSVTATMTEPGNGSCVSVLGSGGTTMNADSAQIATTLTVPGPLGGDVFFLGNAAQAQGCTFRDINILAQGNATHGFELQWFRGTLIDNVTVNDTTAEGILLGEETTSSGHQANFLLRNVTVSYSSAAFTPANRAAYGIHLQKTAMDSHLDDIVVRNALTAGVYNEGTGNTGYLIHGFGYPYTCTAAPCANNASSASAANASYATSYVIYDMGGSGSVWTDTYADSPAVAGFYVGANGIAIHGGHIQWPDLTSFPAANLAYVASTVTNNLLIADVDCLEMNSGVTWITYAATSGNPPTYASVHHLTGCGNYYQALEPAQVTGFSSGGANINDPSSAVPRVWSTPIASAASYPAYAAQMYTGYQGDAFQAHFSGVAPFFNVTYQGTIRTSGGLALGTVINTASALTLTAANKNVIANAAGAAQTLTLPSCYTALPDKATPTGLELTIIKPDTSSNAVTLQTVSSQNINYNGVSAQTLAISSAGKRTLVCGPDYNWYAY